MPASSQNSLLMNEERLKERVYKRFDEMISEASDSVRQKKNVVSRGSYDDQAGFMVYNGLADAQKKRQEIERLVGKLYDVPYFAHIEVSLDDDSDDREDYFLSDCESLNESVRIGSKGMLLPFKSDPNRPISKALFHCYQSKKGDPIPYKGPNGDEYFFVPQLICNTDIWQRKLKDAISVYPLMDVSQITADELLELRLQENRNNPVLRNIISTLQRMQFEIIETSTTQSFVVQGCAGSGKSQCMLHRLFYLRDVLAKDGWDNVLLLTPTKLFRQYSADLIRRYQLSDIHDCSIADLYKDILAVFDKRFRDRQYVYQMTEEYLPDEYLFEVYDETNVNEIEAEINNAIENYVKAGCDALGINMPENITHFEIENIILQLEEQMKIFDEREEVLQDDIEYREKRKLYEQMLKDVESNRRKHQRYLEELEKNKDEQERIANLELSMKEAEKEREEWIEQRKLRLEIAIKELELLSRKVERGTDIQAPAKYARQIFVVKDLTEGTKYQEDEEYLAFLNEYCEYYMKELAEVIGNKKLSNVKIRALTRQEEIEKKIFSLEESISGQEQLIKETEKWLRDTTSKVEGEQNKNTLLRSEMERARYFLTRIESAVFEREVWNALSPVKEKYNIQTLDIEELKDGKRKESRILYKSDLLFYVKIYMKLHPDVELPKYSLICIDEGQDLHGADYDIMHGLYPKATFNIFGDINQVLHSACGIHDWEKQTGISDIRFLSTNYRNTAAIVDFCKKKFGVNMEYIGRIVESQKPMVVSSEREINSVIDIEGIVVIVKDKKAYQEFCADAGISEEEYIYMDTLSGKCEEKRKECYSIFAAKGLEFKNVFVYAKHMTKNQKVVACTRAMGGLYYYE